MDYRFHTCFSYSGKFQVPVDFLAYTKDRFLFVRLLRPLTIENLQTCHWNIFPDKRFFFLNKQLFLGFFTETFNPLR